MGQPSKETVTEYIDRKEAEQITETIELKEAELHRRIVRFRSRLRDGTVPGATLPDDGLRPERIQRGWQVDLSDARTGEQITKVQHATIELDSTELFTAKLTFADGTTEDVYAFIG